MVNVAEFEFRAPSGAGGRSGQEGVFTRHTTSLARILCRNFGLKKQHVYKKNDSSLDWSSVHVYIYIIDR
jgi:hypothetical protein